MCSSKDSKFCIMVKAKRITDSSIKSLIFHIWLRKKDITFRNMLYIQVKVRQMLPLLDDNSNYIYFSENSYDCILLYGVDDDIELDDDLAIELAKYL